MCKKYSRLWLCVATVAGIAFVWTAMVSGDDDKKSSEPSSPKQAAQELTKSARTAKDFSQIITHCQAALDGQLNDADRNYFKSLKSWALNRRCEKRIEISTDFSAAGNERQAVIVKDEALADAIEAISLDGTRWRAFLNRGILFVDAGLVREGLTDFQTVCRLQPTESVGWYNCAEVQASLKDFSAAIDDYTRAIENDAADLQALTGRGLARFRLADYDDALKDFEVVVRMRPSDAAAFINRGDARQGLAQWRDAYDDYVQASEIADDGIGSARTAWLLATCPEAEFYRPDTALDLARHAIAKCGETVGNLEALAAAHAAKGEFRKAIEAQQKAVNLDKDGDSACRERLDLYQQNKPFAQVHQVESGQMRASTPASDATDE